MDDHMDDPRQQVTKFDHDTLPEDIFEEFKVRRGAILKALTTDVEKFYQECDPEKEEELGLYGYIDGKWKVVAPLEYVPPELPEPTYGINFARDGMQRKEWLGQIAIHSDSWLLYVSFFYATKCEFDKRSRSKLFQLINSLPSLHEIVYPTENKTSNGNSKLNKAHLKSSNPTKVSQAPPLEGRKEEVIKDIDKSEGENEEEESNVPPPTQRKQEGINDSKKRKRGGEEEEESEVPPPTRRKKEGINNMKKREGAQQNKTSNGSRKLNKADLKSSKDKMEGVKQEEESKEKEKCGYCGSNDDYFDKFWIGCDTCQSWFHGKCVGMTRAKAKSINNYHCPECLAQRSGKLDLTKCIGWT